MEFFKNTRVKNEEDKIIRREVIHEEKIICNAMVQYLRHSSIQAYLDIDAEKNDN